MGHRGGLKQAFGATCTGLALASRIVEGWRPDLPPELATVAARLATSLARLEALTMPRRSSLLKIRPWPVREQALAIARFEPRLDGSLLRVAGFPHGPTPGAGLQGASPRPGVGQDLSTAVAAGYLGALAASESDTSSPVGHGGVLHSITVQGLSVERDGLDMQLRARSEEGCGWIDLSAGPVRGSARDGIARLTSPSTASVPESGGVSCWTEVTPAFTHAALDQAIGLLNGRLAHPLVLGPRAQATQALLIRREGGALVVDARFSRGRQGPRQAPRPSPRSQGQPLRVR